MTQAPLLQLSDIAVTFGGQPLLAGISLVVQPGERLALVGRNGCGKSTLMKLMAGLIEPDQGSRILSPAVRTGYMEQEPDLSRFASLGAFAAQDLAPEESYKIAAIAEGLKFDPDTPIETASGGERRRAALARLLAGAPDLMLLDEPTNHLDIQAIEWLERELSATRTAFVLISHDRMLLRSLSQATLWLDRGALRRRADGFQSFEEWRDTTWAEEDTARHKLNRKIKAEEKWAIEGISARRKRNMGRVRALQGLRAERAAQIRRTGPAALALEVSEPGGRNVIEAKGISKSFGDKMIVRSFDLRISRGERVALVGPNGVGKTTLVNLLLGREAPDSGKIKLGTNLEVALFDQSRAQLDPESSLWTALCDDPQMRVSGASDQVMVRGKPRHVIGYLKDFLFEEARARAPIKSLSGGEKARLLLAKLMAQPSNLLVLDEPTNDLDVETLDLLQDLLADYAGTVLLVSHDRDFIDRVATSTIAFEGQGKVQAYPGGWSDYLAQRPAEAPPAAPQAKAKAPAKAPKPASRPKGKGGLGYSARRRLEELPAIIDRLEAEIGKLNELLSDGTLYSREPVKFAKASEALTARQSALAQAEEEWLTLAAQAEEEGP